VIPYGRQHIDEDDINAVVETLKSDWLTQGPAVPQFEQALADYCHVQFGVAVNSATSALHIACLSLGVGAGDRVWTSPNSFVASANCALYCGAEVDFVDIDITSGNLCAAALADKLERAARTNTLPKVVIPVHFAGQSCDMEAIAKLAQKYGFKVIEDASHAVGASYQDSRVGCCQFSDICIFSFHPVNIITTLEGGMAMTNNAELASTMRLLRSHGVTNHPDSMKKSSDGPWYYEQIALGYNYRMNDVEAALGASQVNKLSEYVTQRNRVAAHYDQRLSGEDNIAPLVVSPSCVSSFHLYVVRINAITPEQQSWLVSSLREAGIFAHLHYIPIHTQPFYQEKGFNWGDFPAAENYYRQAVTLPVFPDLTPSQVDFIADTLLSLVNSLTR